jgi:prepilin-type N-terminal cleavage/methylation domain-containing protein
MSQRQGFTLLEVLIVLALLGILASQVAPAFPTRPPGAGRDAGTVLEAARRLAVQRAAPLVLSYLPDGTWVLTSFPADGGAPVASGTLASPSPTALRFHISPLGGCTLSVPAQGGSASPAIDPVHCRIREEGR